MAETVTLTLEEIIQDIRALDSRIRAYERKYSMTSHDFYSQYQAGLLDDEGFEQSQEYARWASAYTMKLAREAMLTGNDQPDDWSALGLRSFKEDWDNPEDAVYDNWRKHYGTAHTIT